MLVLKTVLEGRRRVQRAAGMALLGVLLTLGGATTWWATRGGEPVDEMSGLELPYGTRLVYEERIDTPLSGAYHGVYLACAVPVSDLEARFAALHTRNGEPRRYHLPDGTIVTVSPSFEIPATHLSPVREVAGNVPLGTRSWIVIEHGEPPTSTSMVAVPPLGES